jgi:hypothetical protein
MLFQAILTVVGMCLLPCAWILMAGIARHAQRNLPTTIVKDDSLYGPVSGWGTAGDYPDES